MTYTPGDLVAVGDDLRIVTAAGAGVARGFDLNHGTQTILVLTDLTVVRRGSEASEEVHLAMTLDQARSLTGLLASAIEHGYFHLTDDDQ